MLKKGLVLAGILLIVSGLLTMADRKETEIFQKYSDAVAFYEKNPTLNPQAEQKFAEIGLAAENKNLKSAFFYNAGTILLEEFLQNKETDSLKKSIGYLQESLRINPGLAEAKRNLERALREVKDRELVDELGLPSDKNMQEDGPGGKQTMESGDNSGSEESKDQKPGNANINSPLPYSDERGYGRGREQNDY
ncbi:MAG: hypothetical protein HYV47_01990 [Candidatus Nealsonbacteria bacterium]|nr:hypothetical protein [Candidatus Nealsonbacteria bacterium]